MNSENYPAALERKLIDNFQREFHSKMGYFPHVITKKSGEYKDFRPFLSLPELAEKFAPFLPIVNDEPLPLTTRRRKREIVELRQIFTYIAKRLGYSYTTIAAFLGKRDHSTAIHSFQTFQDLYDTSESYRQKYETINNHVISHLNFNYDPSTMDFPDPIQGESEPALFPGLLSTEDRPE